MTDFEYIMARCRKFHFSKWDEEELRICLSILPNLTHDEMVRLYRSKWVDEKLRKTVFQVLFADKVGKREERIKNLDTDALIEEFKDKKSGNVALIREELRERYKAGRDRMMISGIFNVSTKGDKQWLIWQIRKERYGKSSTTTNRWKV